MRMLTDWIDRIIERSWNRARMRREVAPPISTANQIDVPNRYTGVSRQFVVREAMNGLFIEFTRHKWLQNRSDEFENCIYIVRDGETLVDAIATVLVLMDKPPEV